MFASVLSALLAATVVNARQVYSGDFVGKQVMIRGVVSAVVADDLDDGFNWVLLNTPDGIVCASTDNRVHALGELRTLLDAEIDLTGVVQRFTHWRKHLGCQMLFDNPDDGDGIAVVKPAAADPFDAPALTDASNPRRQTATGVVVARTGDSFFLRRADDFLHVRPVEGGSVPPVGATVTVSGYAEHFQLIPLLIEAYWRAKSDPLAPLEPATALSAQDLFKTERMPHADGTTHRFADPTFCGQVLRLSGRIEAVTGSTRDLPGLRLNCDGENIFVDLSGFPDGAVELPESGATVSVAGLCYADFDTGRNAAFPRFLGFSLIPRSADDLQIIRHAPFWSVRRLALALTVFVLVACALAVWSVTLKVVSTRRGQALAREQILGARAELKVEERTRLAVELHDSISQTLTGVALQVDAAAGADGKSAKVFLDTARNMLSSCRQELNGCLWDLRSRTFEEKDMTEAVQRTLAPHVGSAKLTVRFNVPREKLSEQTAHAVLRIIRELGTNAVKHGHAKNIKVAGEFHDDTISFSVTDDGLGFDTASAPGPAQGHFGRQGVRERLNDFNGSIRCDSEPGAGAKFTVTLKTSPSETE